MPSGRAMRKMRYGRLSKDINPNARNLRADTIIDKPKRKSKGKRKKNDPTPVPPDEVEEPEVYVSSKASKKKSKGKKASKKKSTKKATKKSTRSKKK